MSTHEALIHEARDLRGIGLGDGVWDLIDRLADALEARPSLTVQSEEIRAELAKHQPRKTPRSATYCSCGNKDCALYKFAVAVVASGEIEAMCDHYRTEREGCPAGCFESGVVQVADGKIIREFHGDDVWRDDEGTTWVRQSQLLDAAKQAWDEGYAAGRDPKRYGDEEFWKWDEHDSTFYRRYSDGREVRTNPYVGNARLAARDNQEQTGGV